MAARNPSAASTKDKAAPIAESRWAWFLQIVGASRASVPMTGRAATLDEAKAAFRASYEKYEAWSPIISPAAPQAAAVARDR
jgi:hypothetical protein